MMSTAAEYVPATSRYDNTAGWFRRCGRSGLLLPAVSLGCWHNFGDPGTDAARHKDEASLHENARAMLFAAFDHGITHFDLANNYGPAPGAAFGLEASEPGVGSSRWMSPLLLLPSRNLTRETSS